MQLIRGIDGVKIAVYDPNPCGKREVLMVHGWPLSAKKCMNIRSVCCWNTVSGW